MTQATLARRIGMSQGIYSTLETGKRPASRSERQLLARALGVTVDDLGFVEAAPDELEQVAS